MFAELRRRYAYLTVRNATVYTLLNTLADEGWVETANHAVKPVLATTPRGRKAFAEIVDRQLRTAHPADGAAFMTALAYLGILTPATASHALQDRLTLIAAERRKTQQLVTESGAAELHMIEAHFYLNRLTEDANWIERTIHRIEAGQLSWPVSHGPTSP
ncbi:hypothetical protein [Microlunatus elymi]|uniref:hypothetical protein n=1 Tax=Microlunatus elymi TaxID=2596828 RepID=UPI00224AEBC9|nr:hypothetical protein [Microlunatus elymi]